jgi:hypothetical protein
MERIIRKVPDISEDERQVLEHLLGRPLKEDQRMIIQVVSPGNESSLQPQRENEPETDELPEWCDVYEGLTDEEIADLDAAIRERANLKRGS